MKSALFAPLLFAFLVAHDPAQHASEPSSKLPVAAEKQNAPRADLDQLRSDVQRLQILVNQMRNNLAFVQTSQTPLKHQFELETDAWQIVVDDMNRRIQRMDENNNHDPQQKDHR